VCFRHTIQVRDSKADTRRRNCQFCREKIEEVDYKNIALLRRFVSENIDNPW
jgi:ribosomal protein S18